MWFLRPSTVRLGSGLSAPVIRDLKPTKPFSLLVVPHRAYVTALKNASEACDGSREGRL